MIVIPGLGFLEAPWPFSRSLCVSAMMEVGLDPVQEAHELNVARIYPARKFSRKAVLL